MRHLEVGDVWIAREAIVGKLTIPNGVGGRQALDIPANTTFTLISRTTGHIAGPSAWWVVSFNGFSIWTSIPLLASQGLIELHSRIEKP